VSDKPTVFIVDDDRAFLDSLSAMVASLQFSSKAFASAQQYLDQFDPGASGCAIIDLRMPKVSGLKLQAVLLEKPIAPPIIMISAHADVVTAVRAMRQGAVDFFQKHSLEPLELRQAIERAFERDTAQRKRYTRRNAARIKYDALTEAEREIIAPLLDDQKNQVIATRLGISRRAVEERRARMTRKLGVSSIVGLARFAADLGIL